MKEGKMLLYMNLLFTAFCLYCVVILFSQNTYMMKKVLAYGKTTGENVAENKNPVGAKILNVSVESLTGEKKSLKTLLSWKCKNYLTVRTKIFCREYEKDVRKNERKDT